MKSDFFFSKQIIIYIFHYLFKLQLNQRRFLKKKRKKINVPEATCTGSAWLPLFKLESNEKDGYLRNMLC